MAKLRAQQAGSGTGGAGAGGNALLNFLDQTSSSSSSGSAGGNGFDGGFSSEQLAILDDTSQVSGRLQSCTVEPAHVPSMLLYSVFYTANVWLSLLELTDLL